MLIIYTIKILTTRRLKRNLISQKNEWEAIKSLKENDSILIKKADKGEAVVVMNKTHYYSMFVKIVQDEVTCKKTNEYCDNKVFKDLEKLVAKFSNFHFQQANFMVYERSINLKLFRKPYKFKTVNTLKYMNPQISLYDQFLQVQIVLLVV